MKTQEWNWQTHDGLQVYSKEWKPEGKPKAVVCLVHGLGEHVGRYEHVGKVLAEAGYALLGADLRGHGKTEGQRGHSPSYEVFMQDIDGLLREAAKRYPGVPVFLYGHSLGGILVLNYALRRKPAIQGVISTGAGLRTALEQQKMKVFLAKVLGSIMPTGSMASGLDPNSISLDPAVVEAYIHDPLVHNRISFAMGKHSLAAIAWIFSHASEFHIPLLIMHGRKDQLGYPQGSQEFAGLIPKELCTLRLWDGLTHEIHNEPEKAEVFKVMVDWLDAQIKK